MKIRSAIALLLPLFSAVLLAVHLDFSGGALPSGMDYTTLQKTPPRMDKLGIWNIWPNYAGVTVPAALDGDVSRFRLDLGFSPADTFNTWLDGHLLSLRDSGGIEVLRVDMVRRGRFRLTVNGRSALSLPVKWAPTVVHYGNLKPETLTLVSNGRETALVLNGAALVRVSGVPSGAAPWTIALGRLNDSDRGAMGWYSTLSVKSGSEEVIPADAAAPGEAALRERLLALDTFFFNEKLNPADKFIPGRVTRAAGRRAAGRLAVDSLWYRLHNSRLECFEIFISDLEKLKEEIISEPSPEESWEFSPDSGASFFLAPDETDFYGGVCGWGLGSYAPELAQMGFNVTAEHVWPAACTDGQGRFSDVMIIRRIMPTLEEMEKYGIRFDLMVAPYTPQWLLDRHPEWDGTFIGFGMEGEAEGLAQHAAQWKGRQAGHGFLKASVISADYREMCIDFMKNALPIIAKSKALAAIDLANEVQLEDYSPLMQQRFRIWLTGKYGTIQALNQAWKTRYADFSAIFMVRPMVFDRSAHQRFMDWVNFNKEIGTEHFRFLCQLARQHAPGVPLHIKTLPHEFGMPWYEFGSNSRNFYDYADGVDRREFTAMTEIIGTDSWADNPHDRYGRLATDLPYQSAYFSYLRGLNPGKWIFDSEWHIIRTDPPVTPHKCLDMVMTQNFVQGLRAGTFWVASPGIYQKLDLTSQPRLLLQAGMTTARLRSQSRYYDKLARRERPVGILYSPRSRYLDRDRHTMSLLRLSEAALFTGVSYKLVDSRDATALKPGSLKCLLVPECLEPEAETRDALAGFAAAGGKVVFTGSFAGRTPEAAAAEIKGRTLQLPEDPRAILPLLTGLFADADLMPEIRVTDGNGKPVFGIEWHTVPAADGNLLYITNMNKKACRLRISSPRGAIVDLNTGGTVPGEIFLNTWDTFLGIIKN